MKKYFNIINIKVVYVCLFFVLASSCSDEYLDLQPETVTDEASFFKTQEQMEQAVNGAYVPLRNLTTLEYWVFGEMRSDNTDFQFYQADRGLENRGLVDYFLIEASADSPLLTFWQGSYQGISRCNTILDHMGEVEDISDEKKSQYTGEASFLRAFYYYNLVFQFGGVPLELTVTTSPSDAKSEGRASKEDVLAAIEEDLQTAIQNLPAQYNSANRGRATSGAAKTLLAKLYMMQHKYDEAITVMQQISGYSILTGSANSYKSIFDPANKGNSEIIFAVQYLGSENGLGSNFMYQFAPNTSGNIVTQDPQMTTLGASSGWNTPTQDLLHAYEDGDLRKDASLQTGFTDAQGNFVNQPYVSKYNFGFDLSGSTSVNFPTLRYADIMLMLAEALNEKGFVANGEAFDLVNQIRNRAGLSNLDPTQVNSQASFREAVYHERRVELAFENHRWYDLLRSGNAVSIMNAHGQEEIELRKSYIPSGAYNLNENKLLLPIPQRAVTLDNLEQNPQ
ncbi:RagB/SusD family nutrient uptake outer membrane protein [Zhouia sp. PK063]|uniref:RagB/SusD family nutrient uptake outer membrane protein n=1 Tax=Zhouia sp. PK063 TaxID=3373602 RepID=UPI0037B806D0